MCIWKKQGVLNFCPFKSSYSAVLCKSVGFFSLWVIYKDIQKYLKLKWLVVDYLCDKNPLERLNKYTYCVDVPDVHLSR